VRVYRKSVILQGEKKMYCR